MFNSKVKPIQKFRLGTVEIAIWPPTEKGFMASTISHWRIKDETRVKSTQWSPGDLVLLARCLEETIKFLMSQGEKDA